MVATQFIVAALAAAVSATAMASEEAMFASLLKRQEPGTPSYNCHANCGNAITLSKRPNPCESEAFKTNYENCLTCSGPDNFNIWRYYGGTLSTAGAACGLETEPKSGEQPDVGPAVDVPAASSAAPPAASSAPPAASQAASSAAEATSGSAAPAPSASAAVPTTPVATTPVESASVTAAPSASGNGTTSPTLSAPLEVSTNAAPTLGAMDAARVLGAVVVGAMMGM
ncbi:hypothetical protein IQ07DRAFT_588643 [Pyrenochaeta sp. DS3sAY3a]|nr:hypothetical protein IQ07DRAFT_588643 [Pyrenochaeta sp. DS3sAY3a]